MRTMWLAAAAGLVLAAPPGVAAGAGFVGLGQALPTSPEVRPAAVSGDGTVVVGTAETGLRRFAFRWTSSEGLELLEELTRDAGSDAAALSADGAVIAGRSGPTAFRWTRPTGMQPIEPPFLPPMMIYATATGLSADGTVVCGHYDLGIDSIPYLFGFRWAKESGWQVLDKLGPLEGRNAEVRALSADGKTIVGTSSHFGDSLAFAWTADGGGRALPMLTAGDKDAAALGVTADGAVIVGWSGSQRGEAYGQACRWTNEKEVAGLGWLPGGAKVSEAHAVSADGAAVVGTSESATGREAFLWDATHGMRRLYDVLVDDCGLTLGDWHLETATGISADGLTVVGIGTDPAGMTQGWVATLPEPATLALLVWGAALALTRRQRR